MIQYLFIVNAGQPKRALYESRMYGVRKVTILLRVGPRSTIVWGIALKRSNVQKWKNITAPHYTGKGGELTDWLGLVARHGSVPEEPVNVAGSGWA